MPVEEFVREVSGRTGLTAEEAHTGTGTVLDVLREWLGEDGYRSSSGSCLRRTWSWRSPRAEEVRAS